MIQELREYSNSIFFKILLGVIAITFVLSFGVGGFFGDRKEVIATVNDNEILLREYREAYQNRIQALRQQFGESADQIAEQINLRQQVFEQLIDRYLLLSEAADMNLMTTDLELQDYIRNQPFFQKNGQFDYATYETVLSQNRIVRHEYENSLRADILLTKKQQLIGAGLVINDREVEHAYRMDFEKIASENPNKIVTHKIDYKKEIELREIEKIIKPFNFDGQIKKDAEKLIKSLYKILIEKDATLIEINPLIITKNGNLICLDAKMNFDDNAIFRRPEILKLRDLDEEEPAEIEASKHDLAYIKLNGSIGCMVNGAGLAMATMDIIKLHGEEPANFLDVGGGASKEKVTAAFKLILSDKNVRGILINIFGGIMKCDVLAQGVVEAAKERKINVPLVVRLAGTNFEEGKKILQNSNLKIISADNLDDAAKK